tara:strand:- start:2813 stop:3442 length:630 start_codon:yes stop_codon:yes gene_type:complete
MEASKRIALYKEYKDSEPFFEKKVGFGNKRAMSEGHRFYYENEGVILIGKMQGLFIHGKINGKPTNDYIVIPPCTKLLSTFMHALYEVHDELSIDPDFELEPQRVQDFIFHQRSHREVTHSLSRGRYGSRFKGMVVVKGVRFKIHLGAGVIIQPLIEKGFSTAGDELYESKSYLSTPANKLYFSKLAEAVDAYQSELFYRSVMEMSDAR